MNLTPIIRILLRVVAGYLIGAGVDADVANLLHTDPHLAGAIAGGIVWAASEGWYWLAKRRGWST
jgi:hypothetical protein